MKKVWWLHFFWSFFSISLHVGENAARNLPKHTCWSIAHRSPGVVPAVGAAWQPASKKWIWSHGWKGISFFEDTHYSCFRTNIHSSLAFLYGAGSWTDDRLNLSTKRLFTPWAWKKTTMGPVYKDTKKIVLGTFQSWGSDMPHDAYVSDKPPRNERVSWLYVVLKGEIGVITYTYMGPMRKLKKRFCKHWG